MNQKRKSLDIIDKILDACYQAKPDALFIMSLMHQYEERGSLSRKQLQGLHSKASQVTGMSTGWLASLEAIILKMPVRDKTAIVLQPTPALEKDAVLGNKIAAILEKYPQHKTMLFLRSKYDNNETITTAEVSEADRLFRLLTGK